MVYSSCFSPALRMPSNIKSIMSRSTMSCFGSSPTSSVYQMCGFDTLSRLMSLRTNTRPSSLVTYFTGKRTIILTISPYAIHFVAVRYVRHRPSQLPHHVPHLVLTILRFPIIRTISLHSTQLCFHLETLTILQNQSDYVLYFTP